MNIFVVRKVSGEILTKLLDQSVLLFARIQFFNLLYDKSNANSKITEDNEIFKANSKNLFG